VGAAGVPLTTLRIWEGDRRGPGLRAGVPLAKAVGTTAEDLADTAPVEEVGRLARPAGPTKRAAPSGEKAAPKRGKGRK
jgi:hypothetical protein